MVSCCNLKRLSLSYSVLGELSTRKFLLSKNIAFVSSAWILIMKPLDWLQKILMRFFCILKHFWARIFSSVWKVGVTDEILALSMVDQNEWNFGSRCLNNLGISWWEGFCMAFKFLGYFCRKTSKISFFRFMIWFSNPNCFKKILRYDQR